MEDLGTSVIWHMSGFLCGMDQLRLALSSWELYREIHPKCDRRVRRAAATIQKWCSLSLPRKVFDAHLQAKCITRRAFARWIYRWLRYRWKRDDMIRHMIMLSANGGILGHCEMTDRAYEAYINSSVLTLELCYYMFDGCPNLLFLLVIYRMMCKYIQHHP